jgi:MerR family transcriptional regulator, redox-sensitive transcriptional activator SoxR
VYLRSRLNKEGPPMPALLTIGEVARCAGVRASAIRYYEEAGLLPEPERIGGKRRYEEGILRRLALIEGAKRAGFTLGEIRTLLHGFPTGTGAAQRWQALASEKLVEVEEAIAQLREARELLEEALRCKCVSLGECARLLHQT